RDQARLYQGERGWLRMARRNFGDRTLLVRFAHGNRQEPTQAMRRSSRSRRRATAIPWMSVAVLAVLLAVSCSRTIQALFIYDSAAISNGEIWRIATGNLVHCSGEHLFWNSFVLGAVGVTIER